MHKTLLLTFCKTKQEINNILTIKQTTATQRAGETQNRRHTKEAERKHKKQVKKRAKNNTVFTIFK